MKTIPVFVLGLFLFATATRAAGPAAPIVPEGWVKAQDLNDVQEMLQKQLDTGVDMVGVAWKMATVRDVQLFAAYIALYETLPDAGREALRKEQAEWLKKRTKAVASVDDGTNGQVGRIETASQFQDWTEKRMAELQKRMPKSGKGK